MSDFQKRWVIPDDPSDLAPLPALLKGGSEVAVYDRKRKEFGNFSCLAGSPFALHIFEGWEQCRQAMVAGHSALLKNCHSRAKRLSAELEHISTIPTADFPDGKAIEEEGVQREEGIEGEAQQKEVTPAKTEYKRPLRRS
jgi:hypothetical protein